jgi:hypothetical protein
LGFIGLKNSKKYVAICICLQCNKKEASKVGSRPLSLSLSKRPTVAAREQIIKCRLPVDTKIKWANQVNHPVDKVNIIKLNFHGRGRRRRHPGPSPLPAADG